MLHRRTLLTCEGEEVSDGGREVLNSISVDLNKGLEAVVGFAGVGILNTNNSVFFTV